VTVTADVIRGLVIPDVIHGFVIPDLRSLPRT
jgi:hypothetical protein